MISERQASSKTNTSFSPITGDTLVSKIGNHDAYSNGWERIFGNKESEKVEINFTEELDKD